jgi:hypothetical protein
MKAYGRVDVQIHVFLTSTQVGKEWSASLLGEKAPHTFGTGDWVGPRTGLDNVKKKYPWPYQDSNSDPLVAQPIASRYIDCDIPALLL